MRNVEVVGLVLRSAVVTVASLGMADEEVDLRAGRPECLTRNARDSRGFDG